MGDRSRSARAHDLDPIKLAQPQMARYRVGAVWRMIGVALSCGVFVFVKRGCGKRGASLHQ